LPEDVVYTERTRNTERETEQAPEAEQAGNSGVEPEEPLQTEAVETQSLRESLGLGTTIDVKA